MKNRPLVLVAVGVVLGMSAWWITQNYGLGKERVWVGYSGEARVNRYYAAALVLEQLGMQVQQRTDLRELAQLPPDATILLTASREELDKDSATELLSWVERGGHLVVGVEYATEGDELLDALNVEAAWDEDGEQKHESAQARERKPPPTQASKVALPDGRELRVDLLPSPRLIDHERTDAWVFEDAGGARMLDLRVGEGHVMLLSTLRMVANQNIGRLDHARLLAWLSAGSGPQVWLIRWLESPSLLEWLWEHARVALAAGALFVAFALWRIIPRFGPLAPSPVPDRKSLLEHIRALGRFYSDHRRVGAVLKHVRSDCQELLDRTAPEARGLEGAGRLEHAARITGLKARDLLHAFTANPATHHELTNVVRMLAQFRQRLARREHNWVRNERYRRH